MNWQPIETAPRDGTLTLVWVEEEDCHAIAYHTQDPPTSIRPGLGMWIEPGAGRIAPTHWMPLPPPPTVSQSLTVPLDDDLDEPLGPACSRENPECEACQ